MFFKLHLRFITSSIFRILFICRCNIFDRFLFSLTFNHTINLILLLTSSSFGVDRLSKCIFNMDLTFRIYFNSLFIVTSDFVSIYLILKFFIFSDILLWNVLVLGLVNSLRISDRYFLVLLNITSQFIICLLSCFVDSYRL